MTSRRGSIHWFKKHPEFLKQESTALSNDSNYREIHQNRDNLFVSHGNVIVRLNEIYRHPVLIVYPDATPYQLPLVFPLKEEMSVEEVTALSELDLGKLFGTIKPKIKFYHHLRHQNSAGVLCFLERADLDTGAKFYGISTILKRLRDWFAGHVTGSFPPDNEAVEYCAHFSHINKELEFLYPEAFVEGQLVSGQFYATLLRQFPRHHSIYHGSLIDGLSRAGIQSNSQYLFVEKLDPKLVTSLDFQTHRDLVGKFIEKGYLLTGLWFHIDNILTPFEGFDELINIIGHGDREAGIQRFVKVAFSFFPTLMDKFHLGIRYPNTRGDLEFQLFEVHAKDNPPTYNFSLDPEERIRSILVHYQGVQAIWSEKITEENFHLRNGGRAKQEVLKHEKVNLLGVGSLGSEIGDSLSKSGIGNFILIDNQPLRAHNAVRHVGGLGYIGVAKTHAMKEILSDHNPFIKICTLELDIFSLPDLMLKLPDKSITVSSIADDNVEGFINEQAVAAGKTVFYSRALRGGKVGRIFRVIPGTDACFQCLSLYLSERESKLRIEEDPDFPVLMNECNNPIRPASASDLKILSSIASRLVIEHLQEGISPYNHWIWSTEVLPQNGISSAYTLQPHFLEPHPQCYYCHPDKKLTVSINADALEFMKKLVEEKKGIETGGVLAGVVEPEGTVHIIAASEPGPEAVHTVTEFRKDVSFCQAFLDKLYVDSDRQIVYVGEWHSHPGSDNRPSGLDILSLTEISEQKEYLTTNPLMIIFSNSGEPSCTVHPTGNAHYGTELHIHQESLST